MISRPNRSKLATCVLVTVIAAQLCAWCISPISLVAQAPAQTGTSVVILVDFSRSFVPLTQPDQRALEKLVDSVSLASTSWDQPVTFSWAAISSSSLSPLRPLSNGPCRTFEVSQKLIKNQNDMDDTALRNRLENCVHEVMEASAVRSNSASYTDISGAIRLATEGNPGSERNLVILSDFKEELAPGAKRVPLRLHGERVLLIHRPGTDDNHGTVAGYLQRIDSWKNDLRAQGAAQVLSMPVFGVTTHRIVDDLNPQKQQDGTALSIVVNLPDTAEAGALIPIATAVSELARNWTPPVTVTWLGLENSAFAAKWMPPVEFAPSLIKKPGATTLEDLNISLEQSAAGMEHLQRSKDTADLSGAIALAWAANQSELHKALVVVSDFRDLTPGDRMPPFQLDNSAGVMIAAPSKSDFSNQPGYFSRLDQWEKTLAGRHARHICRTQLASLTEHAIVSCLQ
jgi:hypothetical protein